jgi:carboxyl-terminal processing protease
MKSVRALWLRSRELQFTLLMVTVFVSGFALGSQYSISAAQGNTPIPPEAETLFEPFWQVYNLIQNDYLEPVAVETLLDGAINGMVDALDDEFSGYMNPEVYPLLNDDLSGEIEGIGVVIHTIEETGEIEVVNVLEGAPAMEAGIMPGDIFTAVNGEEVIGLSQLELAGKVRGAAGTPVTITMRRGEELIDFTMNRARIEIPTVESRLLEHNIGYIRLFEFNDDARAALDDALEELNAQQLNGLIFDLRGNPGGLLNSAIDIASAFLEDGVILIEDFGDGQEQTLNVNGNFSGVTVPLVVLVDETSASASELVAGALQDQGRATIIGETTFGKGTVQTWHALSNGGGVRLTIARWLTPNRHWIHEQGITPDIIVEWTPESYNDPNDIQLFAAQHYLESLVASEPEHDLCNSLAPCYTGGAF